LLVTVAGPWPIDDAFAAQGESGQVTSQAVDMQQEEGEDAKSDDALPYLFAVFIITWAGFFGYVFVMSRRQRETQRELDALKLALVEKDHRSTEGEQ
jgi:CcmD family protein